MKNVKVPVRPAPSFEEARRKYTTNTNNSNQQTVKKKPPPRPPPPDFNKIKSKSTWNLSQPEKVCLIEWSPPNSPKSTSRIFGGSISSSFSSSTSSLASSKKSFEFDMHPWNNINVQTSPDAPAKKEGTLSNQVQSLMSMPTIIRAQSKKKYSKTTDGSPRYSPTSVDSSSSASYSPPMPMIPPPSPPKDVEESILPFGIALYSFPGAQIGDLPLQVHDIVILLKRINNEWLYGRIGDREGMFPASFIDIQVPLPEADDRTVIALYEFRPQMPGDLALMPGQVVRVLHKISNEWLAGESNGQTGQFPANFVDRIPSTL